MDLKTIAKNPQWDEFLKLRDEVKRVIRENEAELDQLDLVDFLKFLFVFFNPQSYGSKIEKRIIKEFWLEKVPASEDRWDFKSQTGKYGEIKSSYLDSEWRFHFVQIRPYQNNDFYLLVVVLPALNFEITYLLVSKDKLDGLLENVKANNCHWVKKNKDEEEHIELRFSVEYNSDVWKYMVENFKKSKEEILKIINS